MPTSHTMHNTSKSNYNWNWAETAEAEEQALLARQRLLNTNPDLPTLLLIKDQPFTNSPEIELHSCIPSGIPDTIEGLTAIGCALLNSDHLACCQWSSWILSGKPHREKANLTYSALSDIIQKTGSLHIIPPLNLDWALSTINEYISLTDFCSNALAQMFQPTDSVPTEFEETLYLPTCKTLLAHGALPSHRTINGSTALSGINIRLAEAEISMAQPVKISDLLSCAELLMGSGGTTADVREMPPLEQVVPNKYLYGILVASEEKKTIKKSLPLQTTLKSKDNSSRGNRL